jgi:hypothetical protein
MDTLKILWYMRKVKVYEALIIKMTKAREALKAKQAKYTERQEHYTTLIKEYREGL